MTILLIFFTVSVIYIALQLTKSKRIPFNRFQNASAQITNPTILTPEVFATKYKSRNRQVKGGSVCLWGHWFGKPLDNYHEIIDATYNHDSNELKIYFDEEEVLTIEYPEKIEEYENSFKITSATRIRWEWYLYGNPHTQDYYAFVDISKTANKLQGQTNFMADKVTFRDLDIHKPAVLLV